MSTPKPDVRKTSLFSFVINGVQIALMVGVMLFLAFTDVVVQDPLLAEFFIGLAALVVAAGAVFDIRDAIYTQKMLTQVDDMDTTIEDMASLNNTLRAQRHDFLNHLQVVYSLMEMEEYQEAGEYIERVYGSITSVSRSLKTANPAINALLQVKLNACEQEHIAVKLDITSNWQMLPMPGWEMCKVLSNLIDNAIDALHDTKEPKVTITLTEDLHTYRFSVANNGPMIPAKRQQAIFQPGVTSKQAGPGHGMGLYIVRQTMSAFGGEIHLSSDENQTIFGGWLPKAGKPAETKNIEQENDK